MITILHVITGLDTGGAEMMLAKLVERSDPARVRHVVVSLKAPGPVGQRIAALGVPVKTLDLTSGFPGPHDLIRFLGLLRSVAPDVVQTWLYHADLLGLLGAMVTRKPVVWNIRASSPFADLGRRTALIANICARLSWLPTAIVANSESGRALHAARGYRAREWLVIPNGFDTQRFIPDRAARADLRQELGLPENALLIGLVARFDPLKDHGTFLCAASLLAREHGPHFVLVGRGVTPENAALREIIEQEELDGRVRLLGERTDLPRLTAALDIATCSSYGESFPNVVGEAMACAVPCVVTDVGDAARIVGETGRVVPPRDPAALAAVWQELLDLGPEGRQALGRQARARVEALYSLDSVVRQYEALYERVARTR